MLTHKPKWTIHIWYDDTVDSVICWFWTASIELEDGSVYSEEGAATSHQGAKQGAQMTADNAKILTDYVYSYEA